MSYLPWNSLLSRLLFSFYSHVVLLLNFQAPLNLSKYLCAGQLMFSCLLGALYCGKKGSQYLCCIYVIYQPAVSSRT